MFAVKRKPDEWDDLLERTIYWKTLRVTAGALRFTKNTRLKRNLRIKGPLTTEEINSARDCWVRKIQTDLQPTLKAPGWKLIKKQSTGILRCKGRIFGYQPVYLEEGVFAEKLIRHSHQEMKHLGVANTMAEIRREWWIPQLRSKVKKIMRSCIVCKFFST